MEIIMYIDSEKHLYPLRRLPIYIGEQRRPQFHGGGPTPTAKAFNALKGMKTVGLQLRAQKCGPDAYHVRSEMGFDYVDLFLQIQSALQPYTNKRKRQRINSG
ncbi:MAG: hypothetical protein QW146_06410 [Candidatus Bathyarchaeia archaeon]